MTCSNRRDQPCFAMSVVFMRFRSAGPTRIRCACRRSRATSTRRTRSGIRMGSFRWSLASILTPKRTPSQHAGRSNVCAAIWLVKALGHRGAGDDDQDEGRQGGTAERETAPQSRRRPKGATAVAGKRRQRVCALEYIVLVDSSFITTITSRCRATHKKLSPLRDAGNRRLPRSVHVAPHRACRSPCDADAARGLRHPAR